MSKKFKRPKRGGRGGFALVLALVLMGFMVLLIISLAAIVQLQLKTSRQGVNENKARQAAKFAAYQALAQIQSSLGPDQRISANAMIFDDNVSTEITNLETKGDYDWWSAPTGITRDDVDQIDDPAISQNRYWVGVWDSRIGYAPEKPQRGQKREDYTKNTIDMALTWLVSGNGMRQQDEEAAGVKYKPNAALEARSYVRAVSSGSVLNDYGDAASEKDVRVPLVVLDKDPNPVTGNVENDGREIRMAWWVSDEGQKASLNAVASRGQIEHAGNIPFRLQSLPFYSGIHGLTVEKLGGGGTNAFDLTFEDIDDTSPMAAIRNLDDIRQLDVFKSSHVPDNIQTGKLFFHGVTFDTKGVLANVRNGGLKKDLSIGLLRNDYGNEPEQLEDRDYGNNSDKPDYFNRPFGVAGFNIKSSAYPLVDIQNKFPYMRFDARVAGDLNQDRILKDRGHIFGPQIFGIDKLAKGGSYDDSMYGKSVEALYNLFTDSYIYKDPGGPLWDQLRSYYNLRAEDDSSKNTLDARVQTDDRFGFKPTVKRFQVFYVPSFLDYGNRRYGLRLHIVPLLVLYNPYDTRINGDTYYAIELSGPTNAQPGKFRFAIGYESGDKFQCLRDLRTELMPSMDANILENISKSNFNGIGRDIRGLFMALSRHGAWDTSSRDNSYSRFFSKYSNSYEWANYFLNQVGGTVQKALPLGYGELPAADFTTGEANASLHWKAIVKSTNIYPDIAAAVNTAKSVGNWTTRVAKVPLFLNNLICDVNHGTLESAKAGDDNKLFIGQYGITAFRPYQADPTIDSTSTGWSSTLRFLAYDKNGIEPGQAKVFAMEDVVSYVGGLSGTGSAHNGPNGDIEGNGVKSTYESRGALMKGLDEGGVMGGCFFIDVPHPEAEHEFKYNSGTPYEQFYSYSGRAVYDKTQRNVILDLSLVGALKSHLQDVNGNFPPDDISKYLIDMQDIVGKRSQRSGFAMNWAVPGLTPLGYHYYNFAPEGRYGSGENAGGSNYITSYISRESRFYPFVSLNIWIWKREGLTFSKFTQKSIYGVLERTTGNPVSGMNPLMSATPTMTHMEGFRIFNGDLSPSFPDPTLEYHHNMNSQFNRMIEVGSSSNSSDYTLNYFQMGRIGRKGVGSLVSLFPAYPDNRFNSSIEAVDRRIDEMGWNIEKEHKLADAGNADADNIYLNSRYYINWLGMNARRHSVNYWNLYSGAKTGKSIEDSEDNMMDLAPVASRIAEKFVPKYATSYGKSYANQLHGSISNQRQGYIPYGIVFSQPYAENSQGSQPFFNRRSYVNGTSQSTTFLMDYNTKSVDKNIGMTFGAMIKSMQNISQAFGPNSDGYSSLGYDVALKSNSAYAGMSDQIGTVQAPTHHILRKTEVVSNPANLASAHLSFGAGMSSYDNGGPGEPEFHRSYGLQIPEALQAGHAIGNSLAHSRISPDRSYQIMWIDEKAYDCPFSLEIGPKAGVADGKRDTDWCEDRSVAYDMSWHLNDVLWDEYFFSTFPYRKDESDIAISQEIAYPQNPRLQYYASRDNHIKSSQLKQADENADQFERNSALLWINGPFNVNSTSVDAWKAVLSTFYGQRIDGYDGSSVQRNDEVPMHRWAAPLKGLAFNGGDSVSADGEDKAMQGYRSIDKEEIEELASAIVEHIKDRGPFYSMSQFVNRAVTNYSAEERYTDSMSENPRLLQPNAKDDRKNLDNEYNDLSAAPKTTHMQKGVLQAAIDSTSINQPWHDDNIISVDNDRNMTSDFSDPSYSPLKNPKDAWENWRAAVGPQGTGAPTYLMQQDILSRIGSFLTVRSDTFKIRAYGEIRNPISGIVEGKAWCEMVVQRTPEYFDQISQNQEAWRVDGREVETGMQGNMSYNGINYDEHISGDLSELNRALGRRFKIVSFRWMNEKEI